MSHKHPGRCPGGNCRLCWLAEHDPRYRALWGLPEKKPGGPPSAGKKVISFARAALRQAAAGWPTVSPQEKEARLAVCRGCEFYSGGGCRRCGCNLSLKASWATQDCPEGKWPPQGGGGTE